VYIKDKHKHLKAFLHESGYSQYKNKGKHTYIYPARFTIYTDTHAVRSVLTWNEAKTAQYKVWIKRRPSTEREVSGLVLPSLNNLLQYTRLG